ncbi:MAG: transglycosylase domain-containing protein [Deltaproteobacteria bacterium]|nr:transglycosylase domain-containing protein [Deltaproteobacteria bacterium]
MVAGFGPCVRSQISEKAEAYGAQVEVQHVVPSLAGVRLRGVEVTFRAIPGVRISLDDLVVGWVDRRPVGMSGGKIVAVGPLGELVEQVETWRSAHFRGGGEGGGGRKLTLDGFELDWRNGAGTPDQAVQATGLRIERGGGAFTLEAGKLTGRAGGATIEVAKGKLVLARSSEGYRIQDLASDTLALEYRFGSNIEQLGVAGESPEEPLAAASASSGQAAPLPPAGEIAPVTAKPQTVHRRVRAARMFHAFMRQLGQRIDGLLEADATVMVGGATAKLGIGGDELNLGPGNLSVVREGGDLVVALEPQLSSDDDSSSKSLTFSVRIPLAEGPEGEPAADRPITGELRGGPVWLALLGVKDGDLGLQDVAQTSLESDARVVLPPDGQTITVDGRGKLHNLSLSSKRLAAEPLKGVELAWRTRLEAKLDGSRVRVREAEIDLGNIRALLSGTYDRQGEHHKVDCRFEVPIVSCQRTFESLPEAMVPKLVGMRFAGTLALRGHARFDTADLAKHYDVDWDGANSCRIVEAPAELHVTRFNSRFKKLIYTPKAEEQDDWFGPGSDHWVPRSNISHYMVGAVLTTEDGRFFRHRGFDQEAIINSIRENLKSRRFVRGASTISMQLAKNLYLPRTKTISRKLQEAILTMYLEQELTKEEMMELYLNVIEYGPMVYGIGPAARHYFNSTPGSLSLGQSLYLASILADPKKQYFGSGGVVTPNHMSYLHKLMDEELEHGLRETVVFGSPAPQLAPPEEEIYPDEGEGGGSDEEAGGGGEVTG